MSEIAKQTQTVRSIKSLDATIFHSFAFHGILQVCIVLHTGIRKLKEIDKMTILLDVVGVFENFTQKWVVYLNEKYGTAVQYEDVVEWDMQYMIKRD